LTAVRVNSQLLLNGFLAFCYVTGPPWPMLHLLCTGVRVRKAAAGAILDRTFTPRTERDEADGLPLQRLVLPPQRSRVPLQRLIATVQRDVGPLREPRVPSNGALNRCADRCTGITAR
jgi:hypothetical protein